MVVAQLAEWSLPTPDVRGSNPVTCKCFRTFTVNCIDKTKIEEKRPEMAHQKTFFSETQRLSIMKKLPKGLFCTCTKSIKQCNFKQKNT